MKKIALFTTSIIICLGIYFLQNQDNTLPNRLPTDGTIVRANQEEEGNANRREQYFELMHRTAPDTDWRAIDNQTRKQQYKKKLKSRQLKTSMLTDSFANGALKGQWFERGSKNQSGSITAIDYDVDTDKIYLISGGGTVWKGSRTGNDWTPQNDDLRFDITIIKVIDNGNGGKRLLAVISKVIHYSDDDGLSWQPASGFNFYDTWGSPRSIYVMNDTNNTIYYLAQTWDSTPEASRMWLFISTDNGLTFTRIHEFPHGDANQISMWSPFNSKELYILNKSNTLYEVVGNSLNVLNTNDNLPTNVPQQLHGHKSGGTLTLYALIDKQNIYKSTNNGASWNMEGTLPVSAWDVGIHVSLNDPERLYTGAVNALRSFNSGSLWTTVNTWGEYYGDVVGKLHADIMAFASFYDPSGAPFTLIANHGGISISYDNMVTNTNIALENLNVSQHYDVVTSKADANYMYAGTQDQGLQRTNTANDTNIADWEQVFSGDYGHLIFSNNGQSLWAQYPGGVMYYYPNPRTGGPSTYWTVPGSAKPSYGWMLPSAETADYGDNSMYIAGGNLSGGPGNYLMKLTHSNGSVSATQGNYNFRVNANDGGSISAIEVSKLDAGRLYVSMDDGTFFYSNNNGASWSKTTSFSGPGSWYLYGASILASDITSNVVYYGGSGYSNPAVYKSTNGGVSFQSMSNGLPNTLVHELAANADESLLFAATEVGTYVYVAAQNQWFDMRGLSAPMQQYTSVEYIDSEDVVRFGTYGRGIWDFSVRDCIDIAIKVYLEGPYDPATNEMSTHLNETRRLLPGQTPVGNLVTPTPAGQPYNISPWNYSGTEGADWTDADYTGDETDWVLVSFRTGTAKNTEVARTAGLLKKDGSITFPDRCVLTSATTGPLYIVVEHRNHIGIMTPQPIDIIGGALTYDFTSSDSYRDPTSFGQKQLPTGEWTMYAGDADQSDFPSFDIKGTDKTIWFDNNGVFDYYFSPDFNLDGDINGQDKSLWFDNNGISSRVPK